MNSATNETSITELDFVIAQARIIVSVAALTSIYLDPGAGGFLTIKPHTLTILVSHLTYGIAVYTFAASATVACRPTGFPSTWSKITSS